MSVRDWEAMIQISQCLPPRWKLQERKELVTRTAYLPAVGVFVGLQMN